MTPACSTSENTTYPCNDDERLGGASVDKSTTEVGGSFSVRTNLWLTLKKLDSTEELHSAVVNLAGLQVLHVLGPDLPLAQGGKIHRTAVATMSSGGHLYRGVQKSEVILCLQLLCTNRPHVKIGVSTDCEES